MNDRYVFDLDNTLIMTDELNNASYNYALTSLGIPPIRVSIRITRQMIFDNYPKLSEFEKNELVKLKQFYFKDNIHRTIPNTNLIYLLMSINAAHCILWTSAEKYRATCLLRYYGLENHFLTILYSMKQDLSKDIVKLCNMFKCDLNQLFFFEDNENVVKELKILGILKVEYPTNTNCIYRNGRI